MDIIETKGKYIFRLDRSRKVPKSKVKSEEFAPGLFVEYAYVGSKHVPKFLAMVFLKKCWSADEADAIWSSYEFRILTKKDDWNRKVPEISQLEEVSPGVFIAMIFRNAGNKEYFRKQYENMRKMEDDEDDICEWDLFDFDVD